MKINVQWRSQALKSGWAEGAWRKEVPQRGPGWSPGEGLGVKPPEARYIQTICSYQNAKFSTLNFLRRFVAESVLHLPLYYPLQKNSDLRK